jgi:predicted nucleic acid-binding protein
MDSGAMIARFYPDDPFHAAAVEGLARLDRADEVVVTSILCVAETTAVLSQRAGHGPASRAALELFDWEMQIVQPSSVEAKRAARLMESYADKGASFVDCVSFVLMDARKINTAFTFDEEHFVKLRKLKPWVPIPRSKRAR